MRMVLGVFIFLVNVTYSMQFSLYPLPPLFEELTLSDPVEDFTFEDSPSWSSVPQNSCVSGTSGVAPDYLPLPFNTYFCTKCERIFVTMERINAHIAWHSKFKPCSYSNCDKEFRTSRELEDHIARKHECKESFDCTMCEKTYTTKKSLSVHILRKHQEKKFACAKCDERFAVPGDLNQHKKRAH